MGTSLQHSPVVLCILDGWGENHNTAHNAIAAANTPTWDTLMANCPASSLDTSGLAVGLPEGQMGNSEVGHMNIGSGRVVMQNLPRIDQAISDGSLAQHPDLLALVQTLRQKGRTLHILGLLSPGGVHSHQNHIAALANIAASAGVNVEIHAFLDGRDTPPSSALEYLDSFQAAIRGTKHIRIASVSGRYFAMDRDNRWERVELAYDAVTLGQGLRASTPMQAISNSYTAGRTDEFVTPTVIGNYSGMSDGDGIIMANFRSDRARQILHSLLDPNFTGFKRKRIIHFSKALGMVEYSKELSSFLTTLFKPEALNDILGEVIANAGKKQLRIAETEKYAHVTFFFNGGKEALFTGEDRILVPSPKVATYDLKPEMSAFEVTEKLEEAIAAKKYDLIVVNYANTDMVGHTGFMDAAIKAVEAVDTCLGRLIKAVEAAGGILLITADHGNAEKMLDEDSNEPHTAHTVYPVPFVLFSKQLPQVSLQNGRLCDIAPTVLELMKLPKPASMTGVSLLKKYAKEAA